MLRRPALATTAASGALAAASVVALGFAGCPRETPPPRAPAGETLPEVPAAPGARPPSYVIADPDVLARGTAIAVDEGTLGVIVDGVRVVVRAGEPRSAEDRREDPLVSVERIPAWLGGGYLFQTQTALLVGPTFDGALRPLVGLPEAGARVSFGPRGVLLRARSGQRWMIDLPSGAPAPVAPPGVADVAALPDGRAAALAEGARLFVTVDRGARWAEATTALGGAPQSIASHGGEIWIADDAGHAYRIDPGGVPREIDKIPRPTPERLRPRDPGWHGDEAPLLAAVRRGAVLDDGSAIVAAAGDVARVDLRTGAVRILSAGRLPPELTCETLRAGDDVIAVCAARAAKPSLVVAHLQTGAPVVERTFPVEGPFYAGDDGALVFGGSCDGARMRLSACARDLHGEWTEHGVPTLPDGGADAGGASPILDGGADAGPQVDPRAVVRWVPREGGAPLGLAGGKVPGVYDPVSGVTAPFRIDDEVRPLGGDVAGALLHDSRGILDRRWSAGESGALRGWIGNGQVLSVSAEGRIARSAFSYGAVVESGPFALADRGGRAFQTTDRGATWAEVSPPPEPRGRSLALHRCSPAGCEVGQWVRLGWDATPPPPVAEPEPRPATPAPRLPRAPLREIACAPAGPERLQQQGPGPNGNPEELGFGARRVPVSGTSGTLSTVYRRHFFSRELVDPVHGLTGAGSERALRALAHGFAAEVSPSLNTTLAVMGPSRAPEAYRHLIDFWEPFDPEAKVRQVSFGMRDLVTAAAYFGAPLAALFASDAPEIDGLTPILPADPAGATGLVLTIPTESGQMLGTITGGASPRLRLAGARLDADLAGAVSAVELQGGEVAVLMITGDDTRDVYSIGAGGVALLHHVPSLHQRDLAPAIPDALAVGPGGALAVLSAPSGAEPPSASDPAILFPLSGAPPVILAPWSTLATADDPACRADAAGYRAVVQTGGRWLRVRPAAPARTPLVAAMLARVRWSASRVCLEAIELPDGSRPTRSGDDLETVVVARFTGKQGAAARVGHAPGIELWQPLSCALGPP